MYKNRQDLLGLFFRLEWLLHRHYNQHRMAFGPMGNPHRGQGRVLTLLKMKPEITQKELTYLLDMRPQSLGELLAKMEQSGYITRTPSEKDRRIINIKLTEAGFKAAEQGDQQTEFNELFDSLSQEEQDTLKEYFSRIIDSLEQKMQADQGPQDFRGHGRGYEWAHHGFGHAFGHGGHSGGWRGAHGPMDQRRDFPNCEKQYPYEGPFDPNGSPYDIDHEAEDDFGPRQDQPATE